MGVAGDLPQVQVVDSTASTNDDVMELGRGSAPQGTCVAAHLQTQGRGRRGHVWESPDGGLYLSVLLRPQVPMSHIMGLSAVCGMGVLDGLRAVGAQGVALKWPNDVVTAEGKVAGLLVEAGTGEQGMFAVCGVGINLELPQLDDTSFDLCSLPAASLSQVMPEGTDLPSFEAVAQSVRDAIVARCDAWAQDVRDKRAQAGPLAPILNEYFDELPMMGKPVRALRPDGAEVLRGTLVGMDAWGRATVRLMSGREVEIAAEQASLRELD